MKEKHDITLKISENELRHLIKIHADRVGKSQFLESQKWYEQRAAARILELLEVLKKEKRDKPDDEPEA